MGYNRAGKKIFDILKKAVEKADPENKQVITDFIKSLKSQIKEGLRDDSAKTISGYLRRTKDAINNHPKTAIIGGGLLFGTGPGRWVLGKGLQYSQSNPQTWFNSKDNVETKPEGTQYININGMSLPIQKNADGTYSLINQNQPNDSIGILIQQANTPQSTVNQKDSIAPQQTINDLFDSYQ